MKAGFFILIFLVGVCDAQTGWIIFSDPLKSNNEASFKLVNDRLTSSYGYKSRESTCSYAAPVYNLDGIKIAIRITDHAYRFLLTSPEKILVIDNLDSTWDTAETRLNSNLIQTRK